MRVSTLSLRSGPAYGVISVLLLFGAWLVHLSDDPKYGYGDPFVWTGLLALVVAMVLGLAILGPAHERLVAAVSAAPEGPVPPELRTVVLARMPRMVSHVNTVLVLDVVAGAALGALVGVASARPVAVPRPGAAAA